MEETQKSSDPNKRKLTQTNTGNWKKRIKLMEKNDGERPVEKGSCFEGKSYVVNRSILWPQRLLVNVEKNINKNQMVCSDIRVKWSLIKNILWI